jgi:hypothetical protein
MFPALGEIVFPDPYDPPAEFSQFVVHAAVSGLVGGKLLFPKCAITGRGGAMSRATVPETTINKHGDLVVLLEYKIRFTEDRLITPPANNFVLTKQLYQCQLGGLVASAADLRHNLRPFMLAPNVGHYVLAFSTSLKGMIRG